MLCVFFFSKNFNGIFIDNFWVKICWKTECLHLVDSFICIKSNKGIWVSISLSSIKQILPSRKLSFLLNLQHEKKKRVLFHNSLFHVSSLVFQWCGILLNLFNVFFNLPSTLLSFANNKKKREKKCPDKMISRRSNLRRCEPHYLLFIYITHVLSLCILQNAYQW